MRFDGIRVYLEALVPLSTLLLALMPILGPRVMVVIIAIWAAVLVSRASLDPSPAPRISWRWTLFLALPFLVMLADMGRAPDLTTGWKTVERSSGLLVFPVGFLLLGAPSSDRFREAMMDILGLAAMVLAVLPNVWLFIHGYAHAELVGDPSFNYRQAFGALTGVHPPFAAYFFLTAAVFQVERLLDKARRPWWRAAAIISLVTASLLIGSRMPLFAFAAAVTALLFMHLPRAKAARFGLLAFVTIAVLAVFVPQSRHRISEAIITVRGHDTPGLNSVNIRGPITRCTLHLVKEHWLTGIGQANTQPALDDCYAGFGRTVLLNGSYSTHNQLMHWWLSFGIIGLILFIAYFFVLIHRAWRCKDAAHLGMLVFILLCSLTENVISRQWGLVLFACFNALFVASDDRVPVQYR